MFSSVITFLTMRQPEPKVRVPQGNLESHTGNQQARAALSHFVWLQDYLEQLGGRRVQITSTPLVTGRPQRCRQLFQHLWDLVDVGVLSVKTWF